MIGSKKSGRFVWRAGLVLCLGLTLISWGKYGHEHINNAAIMALPTPLQKFFYNHTDFITTEANLPDVRKYILKDSSEFPRHHIHLQAFGNIDSIPKSSKAAMAKYSAKYFAVHGILPWYIQDMMVKLTDAFKQKHKSDILFLAADLGHYIGDAYMPLHTSINHSGMMTNHRGIHALFESHLPEMFGDTYNYNVGKAQYVADIQKETWRIIIASNHTADTLLKVDRDLTTSYNPNNIFYLDKKGTIKTTMYGEPFHTTEYATAYHKQLKGMVERQMRGAIATTANFWYTAWVNAGKPDLSDLDLKQQTIRNAPNLAHDIALYKQGKLFGIKSEKEY